MTENFMPRNGLDRIQTDLVAAFKARDPARIAGFYAEDALFFTPGQAPVVGRAAITKVMLHDLKDPGFGLDLAQQTSAEAASGDLAYARGTFTASFTNPETKQTQSIGGTYLQIFRKLENDSWEILEDISSPGLPPSEA